MTAASADDFGPKLAVTVVGATSEDDAFPAMSLERHTARTRGWHSAKMSEFPIELYFAFDGLVEVQCVRLLSHESKIPAKIDLYVFTPTDDQISRGEYPPVETADFRRLGYINFSTNEASNYCARELKTVRVKARVQYVKLAVRGCHANGVNIFNQVGLVAADFHGSLLAPYPRTARQTLLGSLGGAAQAGSDNLDAEVALSELTPVKAPSSATGGARKRVEDHAGGPDGLQREQLVRPTSAGLSNFDSVTAQRIKQLTLFKAKAVAEEDYDLAKALKAQIDQLSSVGERIAELEERKRVAVEQEDYDVAKMLKRQIDELRNPRPPQPAPAAAPRPYFAEPSAPPAHDSPYYQPGPAASQQAVVGNDDVPVGGRGAPPQPVSFDDRPAIAGRGTKTQQPSEYPEETTSTAAASHQPGDEHDEKAAVASGAADAETGGIVVAAKTQAAGKTVPIDGDTVAPWERQFNAKIVALAGPEEPHASPVEGSKLKEYQEFTAAFGLYGMSCLFAKKWQLRDAALRAIVDREGFAALTSTQRPPAQAGATTILMSLLSYLDGKATGVNDSIAQVFFTVCDAIKAIVSEDLPGVPVIAAVSGLSNLLPAMLMKAGDSNQRVREKAQTTLLMLAMSPVGTERVASAAMFDPQEKNKGKPLNYRVHEARLVVIRVLVGKVGVSTKTNRTGLNPEAIVQKLCIPLLAHASGDVRDAAMQLIVTLFDHVPHPTMNNLLKDIKPAQRAAIDSLRGEGGAAAGSGNKEAEMASSSIHVEKGNANHPVLEAARHAKAAEAAPAAAASKGPAQKGPAASKQQQEAEREAAQREAQTCQFCGKYDPRFSDATLDAHYARCCPMLCPCPLCGQITEIPTLQQHLVAECNRATAVRQCPTCHEAVPVTEFDSHVASATCIPYSTRYYVCPLCHVKLPPTDAGWDDHLLKAPGCANNPRRYDGGNGEEFK